MIHGQTPDFDGEPLKLVQDSYELSRQHQDARNAQYDRDYKLYQSFIDMTGRDPDRANISIPKIHSIIETKTASEVRALLSAAPFIPLRARRDEFESAAKIQTDILDGYLTKANFYPKMVNGVRIKITYGTSFMEAVPYYDMVTQKQIVPDEIYGMQVGVRLEEFKVPRFRLKVKTWAPWEIYVDPYAIGLEEKGDCRFIIKMQLSSKKQIVELAKTGAYPELDIEKFEQETGDLSDHKGLQILADIGLSQFNASGDQGVILRYESEDRYIDVWNGRFILRSIENPFKHGMINLSRFLHTQDAHTQNQFWGQGEAKSNEVLQSMLNDLYNMTINNHEMMNQGVIYYKKDSVSPDALVRTSGNRVAVNIENDRPIRDAIYESFGQSLPGDHYNLPSIIERMMDLNSSSFPPNRGEESGGRKTLGEAAMLKETGSIGGELSVKLGEQIFMSDFGSKCLSHIDQFAAHDDLVEEVGLERAAELATANPNDLPGGFNFEFKGSDRLANAMIKQRNLRELAPILLQIPNVLQGQLAKMILEAHDVSEREINELILPDEMMIQLQMAVAQQDQQQVMMAEALKQSKQKQGGSTPNNLSTKSKINTTAQVHHDAGKESNRSVS